MFNLFKKKEVKVGPTTDCVIDARVGSTVVLDTSHLIIAKGLNFRNDLPFEYSVTAISEFTLGGQKLRDIHIYNDDEDVELITRVFGRDDIVVYEQVDQVYLGSPDDGELWLHPELGRFHNSVINIQDTDYEKQWSTDETINVEYWHYADHTNNLTNAHFDVENASLFSREIEGLGYEYVYLANEEGEVNVYIGVDFNKNAITVN